MKSRHCNKMKRTYQLMITQLHCAGMVPKRLVLDNEVLESMKEMKRDQYHVTMVLVPPGCHRRNAAEVAIRNFKAHFLSVLAGAANDFPMQLWDRLLTQT